ncbi:hypothetical protein L7D48_10695 [Streptomyces sp. S1A]|uniref:hypothetical protein n=1 Tax=Streptomyces sp. ICN903 TaxID=2964654 RepID=UPI001EDA0DE8|nr:hypothetical protein [Streptomyces sp. ICN903]MCG3041023.1 hypothetical protein [Streptomyces sp. ICN903]
MTVDYETIINTGLSSLSDAATAWEDMGRRFGELHDNYRDHVKAAVEADGWRGESATAFKSQAQVTLEEYAGARDEAKAVGALLKEAYRTLNSRRNKVIEMRDQAVEACMTVNPYSGRCTADLARMDEDRAEIYRSNRLARQELEESWTNKILDAVKDVQDADENFRMALMSDPSDGNKGLLDGFNGALKSDAGEANAARAEELYDKIRRGEKLSDGERSELDLLMRENKSDQEFSRTLITSLGGPDGVIRTHNELTDRAYFEETGRKKHYLDMDRHLADVIATATKVEGKGKEREEDQRFYDKWMKDLREAGLKEYDAEIVDQAGSDQRMRGYQSIVTLMQNGSGYSEQFLHDLADDIRAAEDSKQKGDPDIWDLDRGFAGKKEEDGTFSPDRDSWFANDPYDGVLGIMSKTPDIATAYFDPDTAAGKDRLHYLQKERDWDLVNTSEYRKVEVSGPDKADADSHVGFGAALEAAMTGQVPGEERRDPAAGIAEAQTEEEKEKAERDLRKRIRVFEEVVDSYAKISAVDKSAVPENVRHNMANTIAYYPNDIHDILGTNGDFSRASTKTEPNDISINRTEMLQFVRGVSEDGGAFRKIHDSQMVVISNNIAGLEKEDLQNGSVDARGVARSSGQVMGSLDYIRADVLGADRDEEISRNNWEKAYRYHSVGALFTNIPIVGDSIQRFVDISTGKIAEGLNEDVANKTTEELIRSYSTQGLPRLERMFVLRGEEVGLSEYDLSDGRSNFQESILTEAERDYSSAIHGAQGATGQRDE